jgi:hypothetical protein
MQKHVIMRALPLIILVGIPSNIHVYGITNYKSEYYSVVAMKA